MDVYLFEVSGGAYVASSIVIASAGATFRFESKLLSRCKVDLTFLSIFSASSNNGVRSLVGSFALVPPNRLILGGLLNLT